jgi:cytoskeletal protein CcmA (bactofilin family)
MFSKSKDAILPAPSISATPLAPPKRAGRSTAPSIVSADLTVTGTLVSNGDIQIDGIVDGDVRSIGLVIGEKAEIHGEVLADDITVRGRVIGRIRARKVQLCATSHVEGDILHEAFAVEAGAFFEGNCRHSDNPLADAPDGAMPDRKTAAASAPQNVRQPTAPQPAPAISSAPAPAPKPPVDDAPSAHSHANFALKS